MFSEGYAVTRWAGDVWGKRLSTFAVVAAVVFTAVVMSATTASAAMWSVIPGGKWGCSSTANGCLVKTGFKPTNRYWGQFANRRGNCTNYAAYRLSKNGAANFLKPGQGNAVNWRRHAKNAGKVVNDKPTVGAIAWWDGSGPKNGGGFGHVAYVEKIANGTVYLSDSSWNIGSSRWTVRRGAASWPDAFLHVKDKPKPTAPKPPGGSQPPTSTPPSGPRPVSAPATPKGHLDSASSPEIGKIRVRGWTFDPNAPADPLKVHVYVGGANHKIATANLTRNDVAAAFADAENPGPNHGFDVTFPTSLKGSQQVCVYAINVGSGPNPKIGCKTITIKAPPTKSVRLAKGGSAQGRPGCSSSYCRYLVVDFKNFSTGAHTITCRASGGDEGGYFTYTRSGSSGSSAVCYYGFPGRSVWVTVDGVASNRITW